MAAPRVQARPARPADAAAVSRLVTATFDDQIASAYDETGRKTFRALVTADAIADRLAAGSVGVVLRETRQPVAYGERDGRHIRLLFVRRDRQGRGLSRRLLDALLDGLDGAVAARSVTLNASDFALPRYRALGFVPTGPRTKRNGLHYTPMRLERGRPSDDAGT